MAVFGGQLSTVKRDRLSVRMFICVVLCSTCFTLLLTAYQLYTDYHEDLAAVRENMNLIRDSQLAALANNAYKLDDRQLRFQLQGALKFPHIKYIDIIKTRSGGLSIIAAQGDPKADKDIYQKIPLKYYDAPENTLQCATLRVAASLEGIYSGLRSNVWDILIKKAGQTFLFSFVIFLLIQFFMNRHISTIANYSRRLERDEADYDITLDRGKNKLTGPDELDDLVTSFNGIRKKMVKVGQERSQAREAFRASEERFRDLLDKTSDYVYTHNLDGCVLSVNSALTSGLGFSSREITGRPLKRFIGPWNQKAYDAYIERLRRTGYAEGLFIFTAKDETEHYLEYQSRLNGPTEGEQYVSCLGRDVTERTLARRELKKMEEELSQSRKMEALGTLASGIAHDFNNILQVISGYVAVMLVATEQNSENHKHLLEIEQAIERGAELVRRLLDFGRKVEPKHKLVDLNQEIIHTSMILERTIPKMIDIKTRLAQDLSLIRGDAYQMEQVLMNLATNAKDAMPEGGELVFETGNVNLDEADCRSFSGLESGDYVCLRVSDTGQGVDNRVVHKIFEPFFTTKAIGEGTGLGLATVHAIVNNHGGHVFCRSETDQGTVFTIHLPALRIERIIVPRYGETKKGIAAGNETILLVDDERAILETARDVLEEFGYQTILAESGEEAIDLFKAHTRDIDLVILDLGMPGIGGRQCLKELLSIDPDVKVIIATGYSNNGQAKETMALGASCFIGKPYQMTDLLKNVRLILDRE